MGSVSLTGKDTIVLKSRIMKDFADGDTGALEFPNNLVEAKVGKNGNTIYALNAPGGSSTLTLRVIRGSADDKFLNSEIASYRNDPPSYSLIDGEVIKRTGDGASNVTNDIYKFSGAIIQKIPNVKENVEGDTEQAVAIYQLYIADTQRALM
jgi:hypothetical protein